MNIHAIISYLASNIKYSDIKQTVNLIDIQGMRGASIQYPGLTTYEPIVLEVRDPYVIAQMILWVNAIYANPTSFHKDLQFDVRLDCGITLFGIFPSDYVTQNNYGSISAAITLNYNYFELVGPIEKEETITELLDRYTVKEDLVSTLPSDEGNGF